MNYVMALILRLTEASVRQAHARHPEWNAAHHHGWHDAWEARWALVVTADTLEGQYDE